MIKMNDAPVYDYYNDIIKGLNMELDKFRPFKSSYEMKKEIKILNNKIDKAIKYMDNTYIIQDTKDLFYHFNKVEEILRCDKNE